MPTRIFNPKSQAIAPLIIIIALLMASSFYLLSAGVHLAYYFTAGLIILAFVMSFINTDFALVILIVSMLFSPEFGTGSVTVGRPVTVRVDDIFLILIAFGWLAKMAINKEFGLLKSTPLNKPIMIYSVLCVFSTFLGIINGFTDLKTGIFFVLKYIEYFLVYFMVVNNTKTNRQARLFVFFILLACFCACIYGWQRIPTGERISAPFEERGGEPNTFSGYLVLLMGVIIGKILYPESTKQRFVLLGVLAVAIVPFIMTLSRGGWLAFFPMILTFVMVDRKFSFQLMAILIVGVLLLPVVANKSMRARFAETFSDEYTYNFMGKKVHIAESAAARLDSWKTALNKLSERPVLGFGIPSGAVTDNQYTRVMGETGLVGFGFFMWLIISVWRVCFRVYAATENNNFNRGLSLGFLAGFVGILFHSFGCATFVLIRVMEPFWFLCALVVSLPELQA